VKDIKNSYGTPSIAIRAIKPVSKIKIGWVNPVNYESAQTRIRVLNVNKFLRSKGYYSDIVTFGDIINKSFNIAIVGKVFNEYVYKEILNLKDKNKIVYCDLCESIFDFSWVKEIISICDLVICCSYELEKLTRQFNSRTMVIEDAFEE